MSVEVVDQEMAAAEPLEALDPMDVGGGSDFGLDLPTLEAPGADENLEGIVVVGGPVLGISGGGHLHRPVVIHATFHVQRVIRDTSSGGQGCVTNPRR
jgi:hypothetical protein